MGLTESRLASHLEGEFSRLGAVVADDGTAVLTLHQVLEAHPPRDISFELKHIGTLFLLDLDRDGLFCVKHFLDFAVWCHAKDVRTHDVAAGVRALCTSQMYGEVCEREGADAFTDWFCRLVTLSGPVMVLTGPDGEKNEYIDRATVQCVHSLLDMERTHGLDAPGFFDLCQRVGEELGLMGLDDDALDEMVPVIVIERFAREFVKGFVNMMASTISS